MIEQYNGEEIKILPFPSLQFGKDKKVFTEWRIQLFKPFDFESLKLCASRLRYELVQVELVPVGEKILTMKVISELNVCSPEKFWEVTFHSIEVLEYDLGEIDTIQNVQRSEWQMQFVILNHIKNSRIIRQKEEQQ